MGGFYEHRKTNSGMEPFAAFVARRAVQNRMDSQSCRIKCNIRRNLLSS